MQTWEQKLVQQLDLRKDQLDYYEFFSPKCIMWYLEAHEERGEIIPRDQINYDYVIFPKRFYKAVEALSDAKIYDFCFVGGFLTDTQTIAARVWILEFIRQYMSGKSYLQFTDQKTKENYKPLGAFDFTLKAKGFVPKEVPISERNWFDTSYFQIMKQSQFVLCPAGDLNYSMRFYEALMCKAIPIVHNRNETFRSKKESQLSYKYYLTSDEIIYRQDWAEHNYELFMKHHTLSE
jgi:hypothetical protein